MNQVKTGIEVSEGRSSRAAILFDRTAREYDSLRRKLVPPFEDFYRTAVEILPFERSQSIRVLDLGAGTGLLSSFVIAAFPSAQLTLVDVSAEMMKEARKRPSLAQAEFILLDYAALSVPGEFDAVVSALSIHHLGEEAKRALFTRIWSSLATSGIFVNADQVLGATASIEAQYKQIWLEQVSASKISDEHLQQAQQRMTLDKMSCLQDQLTWMSEAGFSEVNCWFKSYSFAVFSGRK